MYTPDSIGCVTGIEVVIAVPGPRIEVVIAVPIQLIVRAKNYYNNIIVHVDKTRQDKFKAYRYTLRVNLINCCHKLLYINEG